MKISSFIFLILTATCILQPVSFLWAGVLMTQEQALKSIFPGARIERQTVYLSSGQVRLIETEAMTKMPSRVISYYVGHSSASGESDILGYAFFETHVVRTMPETLMIVVKPDGSLGPVEVLAFYEPDDYRPPKKWLQLFPGRTSSEELWINRGLKNIGGASLSAQAVAACARRHAALFRMAIKK